jgi:signal transduction histidine kinase
MWAQLVLVPAVFLLGGWDRIYLLARIVYIVLLLEFIATAIWFLAVSWRKARRDFWLFSVILLCIGGIALFEFTAGFLGLPFKMHLGHLAGPITLLPLCLRLIWLFSDNLRRTEQINVELEQRVAEKSQEIERSYAELADLRASEAAQMERRRIAADLHDDLGAKLLTIAQTAPRVEGGEGVAGMAREALDEMRLSVRGITGEAAWAADVLADWRAETVSRLGAAGFEFRWQADEPPAGLVLPARTHVQVTRILREAVSNAIRHSGGHCCQVQLTFRPPDLCLCVEDDGRGLAGEAASRQAGHGLPNIERRARKLGGWHRFSRSSLGGVRLEVCVPLDGGPSANMPNHEDRTDR